MRDALHHAAVARERVRPVVDDGMAGPVELRRQQPLAQRHADGVGQPLAQRPGRGLDPRRDPVLGMAGRLRAQLPEAAQLVHRQVVAGQMQQRVQQHRAVAVGDDEAVAIRPPRIGGIVAQVPVPQGDRDFGHAHRHARVAALRGFDRIHRQGADGVGEQGIGDGGGGGHGGGDSQIEVGGRAAGATGPRCRHGDPNPRRVSSNDERRTIQNYRVRVPIAQRFPYPLPATAGVRRVAAVLCGRTGWFDRSCPTCPRTAVVHHCGKRPPVNGSVCPGDWTAPPAAAMATQGLERGGDARMFVSRAGRRSGSCLPQLQRQEAVT